MLAAVASACRLMFLDVMKQTDRFASSVVQLPSLVDRLRPVLFLVAVCMFRSAALARVCVHATTRIRSFSTFRVYVVQYDIGRVVVGGVYRYSM
jgi:hypothetical protein